jgi:NADH-quinone oxidoreductase subunit M
MDNLPLLSIITFLPLAGAVILAFLPKDNTVLIKQVALAVACMGFVVSLFLLPGWDNSEAGMQFVEKATWVSSLGISWHLGVDGITLWLILLTTFLGPIVILGSWTAVEGRHREFFFHILALQTFMLGAFVAQNLAVFYLFWELMLIPMFFLIGIWGGSERYYATVKFVLYTVFGSMLMLVAIFYLYVEAHGQLGRWTLEFADLYKLKMGTVEQSWLFAAFALAFAIKVPMWPLHTWLPDAHVQAPTAGSVILAGVLLKMGVYGFLRLGMPILPNATDVFTPWIMGLSVIGIVYGALVAMVQTDIKKLVAYSSVSHMGYITLGVFALNQQGVEGGILQMLSHGISTGGLFLLVGVIYERTHTRNIWDYGGLAKIMPVYTVIFIIVALSSAGLPGTNGFVGEFLTLFAAFKWGYLQAAAGESYLYSYGFVAVACLGVILGAVYLLWMIERVFFGKPLQQRTQALQDLSRREVAVFIPLLVMIFWIGLYPKPFFDKMEPSVTAWIQQMEHGKRRNASILETETEKKMTARGEVVR